MRFHLRPNRRPDPASARLFTLEELRFMVGCSFQAGRELGFRASQQLAVACRQYRTYLILAELQRLEQALVLASRTGEAAGVDHAVRTIHAQFSVPTEAEVAAFGAAVSAASGARTTGDRAGAGAA